MKMASFWIYLTSVLFCSLVAAPDEIVFPTENSTTTRIEGAQNVGKCNTPDREAGQCIRLKDCKPMYDLLRKIPLTAGDRTYLQQSQCGFLNGDVLICCALMLDGSFQQPVQPASMVEGAKLLPAPGECGPEDAYRLLRGNYTTIFEYTWLALLEYTKPDNLKGFHCGGVLINNRYVLTAAHCVIGMGIPIGWRLSSVRLGEWNTNTEVDCDDENYCNDPPIDVPIEEYIPHESYRPISKNQYDDIALLRLSRNVSYTDWIIPVCLPAAEHFQNTAFERAKLEAAGWANTLNVSRSNLKLRATLDGVSLNSCSEVYRKHDLTIRNTQICAIGKKEANPCPGDSGGPLIKLDNTNRHKPYFVLVGVASFGPTPCGAGELPEVYTRVNSYIEWIQRTIRP